ncbi:MAG: isoprenylcysteine carboxylmethyltransferase family protein [Aestuariivirga sp.]|nr:isoprenylcysteine carboxylmethyltransferase family protein [Aestuariivirga sp.]
MTMLDNRIPPPLLMLAFALAMWPLGADGPAPAWRFAAALVVFIAAGAFAFPAIMAFRRANTTIDPIHVERASTLVTSGVFGITRNPMYVSLTLLLGAWAFWLGGPWVWAGPVLLALWLDRFQIRPEERAMAQRFGADYARYREKVRRWL